MNLSAARSHPRQSLICQFAGASVASIALLLPAVRAEERAPDAPDMPPTTQMAASGISREEVRTNSKAETAVINRDQEVIINKFTPHPEKWDTVPQTKASQMFRDIEKRVNATNPEFPITIMDDDSINIRYTENDRSFRNRVYEVLEDRGIILRWNTKSDLIEGLGGLKGPTRRDPIAIRVKPDDYSQSRNPQDTNIDQKKGCMVITPLADFSSRTLVERWVGNKSGPHMMTAKKDPGPYAMMLRATWHEVWHCIDTDFYRDKYVIEGESALDNVLRMHRAEVFADVAATLTLASLYPNLAQDMGDIRAINSHHEARRSMQGTRSTDESYYDGVTYYLTRAQDLMQKHVLEVGIETVSRYTMDDIRRIAREITLQGAMTKEEFRQMASTYASGAAPTERVRQAKERMLEDSGIPVPPKGRSEEDHYDVVDRLRDTPAAEKQAISTIVKERADAAVAKGQRPEQGLVELIDEWRAEVHGTERKPELERKLLLLSMMMSYNELETELGRDKNRKHRQEKIAKELADKAAAEAKAKAAEVKEADKPAGPALATEDAAKPKMDEPKPEAEPKKEDVQPPETEPVPPRQELAVPSQKDDTPAVVQALPQEVKVEALKPVAEAPLKELTTVELAQPELAPAIEVVPVPQKIELNINLNLNLQLQLKMN